MKNHAERVSFPVNVRSLLVGIAGQTLTSLHNRRTQSGDSRLYRRSWRHISPTVVCVLLAGLDFSVVVLSSLLAFKFHIDQSTTALNIATYCLLSITVAVIMVIFGISSGLYSEITPKCPHLKLTQALSTWACTLLVALGIIFFLHLAHYVSRGWIGYWFVFGVLGFAATRAGLRSKIACWRTWGLMRERVVIAGTSETVARLMSHLDHPEFKDAYEVLGVFEEGYAYDPSSAELGTHRRLGSIGAVLDFVRTHAVEMVIVSTNSSATSAMTELCSQLLETSVKVHLCPDQNDSRFPVIKVDLIGGISLLQINQPTLSDTARIMKGFEDRLLAAVLLLVTLPLVAVAALAVRLDSPGPVLFRQLRFGFNNRPISVLKFRTMYVDRGDPSGAQRTVRGDARVTRVGRILRRTSIDELPQLLNVLRGEMSLVGPRAHAMQMKVADKLYHETMPGYTGRHRVKPGLTGLAQVNGCRGEIDTLDKAEARLKYDLEYISQWSLLLDLKIIIQTPFCAFRKVY